MGDYVLARNFVKYKYKIWNPVAIPSEEVFSNNVQNSRHNTVDREIDYQSSGSIKPLPVNKIGTSRRALSLDLYLSIFL